MSRKNRAFALAAATAAIVGLSAPVAGAATFQGPSGFNNDNILNLSQNQFPIAACNLGIPVDVLLAQLPLTGLGLVGAGMLNSTTMSPTNSQTCTQTPTETNTSTTNTNSGNTGGGNGNTTFRHISVHRGDDRSFSATSISVPQNNGPSGFNGDNILNASGNQFPVAICNVAMPITATGLQLPITVIGGVFGSGSLNSTTLNPSNTQGCTQAPSQTNSTTFNTNSNNSNKG
jgi:hypothetical protein